jgi:hypothetical protein
MLKFCERWCFSVQLLLGLVLAICGLVNFHNLSKAQIKYRLCNDVMFSGMGLQHLAVLTTPLGEKQSARMVNETLKKLCHPDSVDHCKNHAACTAGYYCDEDYNCWDCDFVFEDANECDAYDGDCAKCMKAPMSSISKDSTVVVEQSAPGSADFLGLVSRLAVGLGLLITATSIFGFLGDAFTRRTLLFVHHFIVLVLAIAMLYSTVYCGVARDKVKSVLVSNWPWIKESFGQLTLTEAETEMENWMETAVFLSATLTVSLSGGVLASARLLGLRLLAKQMLIITNLTTAVFGFAASVAAVAAYFSGYGWSAIAAVAILGAGAGALGCFGFVAAYTERAGMLKLQMCVTVPGTALLIVFGTLCAVRDDRSWRDWVHHQYLTVREHFGLMSEAQATLLLKSYSMLLGLLAITVGVLMVANLLFTRMLIQRILLDGRYYQPLDHMDEMDEDYGTSADVETARRRTGHSETDRDRKFT